jgi:hypothetical protein
MLPTPKRGIITGLRHSETYPIDFQAYWWVWVSLFLVMPYNIAPYRVDSKWFIAPQALES